MNTIVDMLNEMDFYGHYSEFEYNLDYWNIITCICVRVYLLFGVNNFTI